MLEIVKNRLLLQNGKIRVARELEGASSHTFGLLWGVRIFMVGRRTQEIGIRMALGAQKSNVLGLILTNGISLAAIGLVLGLVGSFAMTPLLGSVLVGVSPRDPGTFVTIALVLIAATAVASWIPANRATHVDPMVALRYE